MPSSDIQIVPPGLLGFLGIKNGGENPHVLGNVLLPSMDVRDWYLQGRAEQISVGPWNLVAGAGVGYNNGVTGAVPDKEFWYVHHASLVASTIAAADRVSFGIAAQNIGGVAAQGTIVYSEPYNNSGVARTTVTSPVAVARGFFLPPGSNLGAWVVENQQAVGPASLVLNMRVTRLPV